MSKPRPRHTPTDAEIVESILSAYRRGYFPMADEAPPWNPFGRPQVHWFSPDPRGVLPMSAAEGLHVPTRLDAKMRQRPFIITVDTAFEEVMRGCALPRPPSHEDAEEEDDDRQYASRSWIDETLIRWFTKLHRAPRGGHAHSVEARRIDPATGQARIVGGIYGVSIGSAFFGESMFCLPRPRLADGSRHPLDGTDASKVCLITLIRALAAAGYTLFDTQMVTGHVRRFGGKEIPRAEYLKRLETAIVTADHWPDARAKMLI